MTYEEQATHEAHARGLSKNFIVPTNLGRSRYCRNVVLCKCGVTVDMGSAFYPQSKSELKRMTDHNKSCFLQLVKK